MTDDTNRHSHGPQAAEGGQPDTPSPGRPAGMDSPCVAVCSTLYDDICRGCGRTAMEVANWVVFDDDEKDAIWTRILAQGYPRRNR